MALLDELQVIEGAGDGLEGDVARDDCDAVRVPRTGLPVSPRRTHALKGFGVAGRDLQDAGRAGAVLEERRGVLGEAL